MRVDRWGKEGTVSGLVKQKKRLRKNSYETLLDGKLIKIYFNRTLRGVHMGDSSAPRKHGILNKKILPENRFDINNSMVIEV